MSIIWNEEDIVLQRLVVLGLFQPPEGAAFLLPVAMEAGEFVDWGFVPSKSQIIKLKQLTHEEAVTNWSCILSIFFLIKLPRIWGNKAFMKSLRRYIMQCQLSVLWYSVLCESHNTLNRCWRSHWPTGLRCRQFYDRKFYDGTDVQTFQTLLWCEVKCVHMPWCLRKKNILSLYWGRACGTWYLKKYF